jgi:integrase
MENLSIHSLASGASDYFRANGYTESSIAERERILRKIVGMHDSVGETYLNQAIVTEFIEETESRFRREDISQIYYRFLNKTIGYLVEYRSTGTMRLARQFITSVSDYYDNILAAILEYTGWNRKSSHSIWSAAKTYFNWLVAAGHEDLSRVTPDVVKLYLVDCASRLSGSSLDTIRRIIKKLCVYLFQQGLCPDSCERLFSFAIPTPRSIKRIIPQEEIALTLNTIDRNSDIGKRDYAAILLAVVTGLRATDIANLKLADIDWRNGEIKIIQSKTGNSLALPLTTDAGLAIRNYIENARQESNVENVFLRSRSPVTGITPAILYGQFNTYRVRAGLPKSSFHGLRRTLGTNMVISGTPITTVSQALGHAELNSTRRYISLDTKHLSECALGFSGIEPGTRKRGDA